jgi:ParB family chromosome partitioning protein
MSDERMIVNKRKMSPKRLGMGLSALLGGIEDVDIFNTSLGDTEENQEKPDMKNQKGFSIIPMEKIRPNAKQPRKVFSPEQLMELSNSIAQNGVLQAILVREQTTQAGESYFEIVAGERRYRASILAELKEMPCIVRELSDEQVFVLAVVENIQREDLNPLEEAESYIKLLREFNYTQEEVAGLVNKSRSHIANLVRLTNLPNEIKNLVLEGKLTGGHVRPLLALKTLDQMLNVADVILQNQYSVRKVEELVNLILNDEEKLETLEEKLEAISKRPNVSKHNNETNFLIEEISKAFHQKFEIPIKIKHSKKGGLISIKYKTETELTKIMQNFVESKI